MNEHENYVVLQEAGTRFDAELLVGALKNAGIEAHADEAAAVDEFSMAEHMRGGGIRILVHEARLAEAREVVASIKEAAAEDEAEAEAAPTENAATEDAPKLVRLREVPTQFEAEFIVGGLRNAGIEAHTDSESPATFDPLANRGARVYVSADRLEEARAVMAALGEAPEPPANRPAE